MIANGAEVWPACTNMLKGTEATELSDARLMLAPEGPAGPFKRTKPDVDPGPNACPLEPTLIPLNVAASTVIVADFDPFSVAAIVEVVL